MAKDDVIQMQGEIVEEPAERNVSCQVGKRARCFRSHFGKMRMHYIRILPEIKVQLS